MKQWRSRNGVTALKAWKQQFPVTKSLGKGETAMETYDGLKQGNKAGNDLLCAAGSGFKSQIKTCNSIIFPIMMS